MAESPSEELGREIERLWSRVGATPLDASEYLPPAAAPGESASNEAAWEAVSLLKRQHRQQARGWAELLEAKERALNVARERLAKLELERNALRANVKSQEDALLKEGFEIQGRLEAALNGMQAERSQHEQEQSALKALLEQTRERLAAEAARWKQERSGWDKKEQQYLNDLRESQALSARLQDEAARSAAEAGRLKESLGEAKNALEKTLSELLRERQVRDESDKERDKALRKVDEVQKHFEELSKLWEEERAQWRELWDRERSTWESQRAEFSTWEDGLRKEREAWHAELQQKEKDQLQFTEQMTRTLRESSEATTKMSAMMRTLGDVKAAARATARAWWSRVAVTAAAAAVCAALGWAGWRYASVYHFKIVSRSPIALSNPTSLAYDGAQLWASEWDGRLLSFDPRDPKTALRSAAPRPGGPYRPVALAVGAETLWSLDAAQARLVRHKAADPAQVVAARPSPGPAPTALAFDGQFLWSYDAANRLFYRHGSDESTFKSYALDADVVATALTWADGKLWVYDGRSKRLIVLDLQGDALREKASYDLGVKVIGLAAAGPRRLWVLAAPDAQSVSPQLVEFSY